jgi:hypothetical protein
VDEGFNMTGIALTDDEWLAIEAAHNALVTIADNRFLRSDEAHLHDHRTGTIRDAQRLAAFTLKRFTPVVCRLLAGGDQKALPPSPGFKLLKDTTHEERSWPEDAANENGAYNCTCCVCLRTFIGHKRRVICRVCKESPPSSVQAVDGDEQ